MSSTKFEWLPITREDIDDIDQIANTIHTELPERKEVFAEKCELFPYGCMKFVDINGKICGYGISHPWQLYKVPPLDEFLVEIPLDADCIYMHDVAIMPDARGNMGAESYVWRLKNVTRSQRINKIACVSVYGTTVLWAKCGFRVDMPDSMIEKVRSYGDTAKYMIADA